MENLSLKSIHRVPVNMVRFTELPDLTGGVVRIVEKHNPETLKILSVYNLLKEHQTEVDKFRVAKKKHELTEEIDKLRKERETIFGALLNLMRGHKKLAPGNLRNAKATVMPHLDLYLQGILLKNNFTQMRLTKELLDAVDSSDAIRTALQDLGYITLIDELRVNYNAIVNLQNTRTETRSAKTRMDKSAIKTKATRLLTALFNTIEINQIAESSLDYTPLINELNDLLAVYRQQMLVRYKAKRTEKIKKTTDARA